MSSPKAIAPLLAPIVGMMPVVAFFVLNCFFSYCTALMAALVVCILYFLIGVIGLKTDPPYTFRVSIFSFLLLIGFSFVKPFNTLYGEQVSVLFAIFNVIVFFIFTRIEGFFRAKILLQDDVTQEFQMLKFDGDIYVSKIVLYIQSSYLLIVLLYQLLPSSYHTPTWDFVIYHLVIITLIVAYCIYEFVHWNHLKKQILNEEWLPIVNDKGAVYGKVALSVSCTEGDKYLHPVIRIALIHKGMLFLNDTHPLDYPFERYLRYQESLEEGIKETFIESGVPADLPTTFIFRYTYKSIDTNRLIYLYACNLKDEKQLSELKLNNGKWWTGKQIDENLGTGLFSTYFEKEYELLNTTVLMADRLMQDLST
jgi:hypothetical protein